MGYEVMARSAVSTRLRKMNSFLEERRQQLDEMERNRENAAKSIQMDLEERLTTALQDASRLKDMLRRSEQDRVDLSQQMERKEKQLRGETGARQQLELQLDRLANQKENVNRPSYGECQDQTTLPQGRAVLILLWPPQNRGGPTGSPWEWCISNRSGCARLDR